jgi:hypothetical protein
MPHIDSLRARRHSPSHSHTDGYRDSHSHADAHRDSYLDGHTAADRNPIPDAHIHAIAHRNSHPVTCSRCRKPGGHRCDKHTQLPLWPRSRISLSRWFARRKLKLIGQTGGNNWVWVQGTKNNCWVSVRFLKINGDFKTLPIVYPDLAKLPHSPYYPPTTVLSATRDGNKVTVTWLGIPVSPGDYEDENMFIYIIEVWRCEGGQMIFDPLAANRETVSFIDEPGCAQPSHGRVFVQDKHGYTSPAEIPWP